MLIDTAIFLAAAVLAVTFSRRFGLGSVLGYLVAGVLIGPYCLGLVGRVEETLRFAEFGVVLLLFLIGLELQPARLWKMRGGVFGLGGAQVLATTMIIGFIALMGGMGWHVALVAGLGLSMSSTAFALQVLGEKKELGHPHGRAAFGILLFQDLAAIPTLALVPLLGATTTVNEKPGHRAVITVAVIAGLLLAGRYLLRPTLRFIAGARSQEASAAAALLVVIGTGLLMRSIGFSMALGAFMAGVMLADSEYRHELEANIEPFKGLLLGLFFMAIGMAANVRLIVDHPARIFGIVVALTLVKLAVLTLLGRTMGKGWGPATSLGIALSQGGEFAFVIFGLAREGGVVPTEVAETLVVAVTLSMVLTPFLFILRDWTKPLFARRDSGNVEEITDEGNRVIIAGFGRFGQIVGRILRMKRIPSTTLDASSTHVDFVRKFGSKIFYGDASRVDLLRAAGADHAELFVLAIDDMEASIRTAKVVRAHFPHLKIIARARNRQHAYALLGLGIDTVIRETFAASLDAARRSLEELGLPSGDARETVRWFASYDEETVRRLAPFRDDEKTLIASAKQYAAELERIFEGDNVPSIL